MVLTFLAAAAAAASQLRLPDFMTGCWALTEGEHWTEECWMAPKAGLMLGSSREGIGNRLKSWEQLRVVSAEGKTILYASPGGRTAVPFEARTISSSSVEFVNASHDFPQRIAYELKGDTLQAEISLADGSNSTRWTYVRSER